MGDLAFSDVKWDRVWPHINAPDGMAGCWQWTAPLDPQGYARKYFSINGRTAVTMIHRLTYRLFIGPIPPGSDLDHLCRNRGCVNPTHVEPVSHLENVRRGERANRTHCPRGHEYTEANTYRDRDGWRRCRTCRKAQRAAWYQEHGL